MSQEEREDLVYAKDTLIAYMNREAELNFSLARLQEELKLEDKSVKADVWALKDEDKLLFKPLAKTLRLATIDERLIICETNFKRGFTEKQGNLAKI